jgi:purine-nucleoside phosphorylase
MVESRGKVEEAAKSVKLRLEGEPRVGLILGTGLGGIVENMRKAVAVPYASIPHYPACTAPSHHGRLVYGIWAGKPVIAMDGRFHLYEGFSPQQIAFPIRVLRALGIKTLLISNAAGGLNPNFNAGDLMVITDHINLTGHNPLIGPNVDDWGLRFPDMVEPYSRRLMDLTEKTALKLGIQLRRGVYAGVLGPSLETAAETRFLRMSGADAVGMSTIMEVLTAVHAGMEILAVSAITNINLPDCYKPAVLDEIIETAAASGIILGSLFEKVLEDLEV